MKLIFSENAWEDYLYWQKTDKKILNRINKLIKETKREPFEGVGKPRKMKPMFGTLEDPSKTVEISSIEASVKELDRPIMVPPVDPQNPRQIANRDYQDVLAATMPLKGNAETE